MTEAQFFPAVGGALVNGIEVENGDLALIGQTAGLADDRVFADILRLFPTDGTTIARAILPYEDARLEVNVGPLAASTVQPGAASTHSINILPFRAVVGSRVAASDPSPDSSLRNWRDLRSANFAPAGGVQNIVLSAGSGAGQNRWDLVFATLTIDAPSGNVTRRVKSPTSSAVVAATVSQYLSASVTVWVLPGTPGATPTPPAIPPDGGNSFHVPLALVRVVGTDTTATTLVAQDIRCTTNTTLAPSTKYVSAKSGFQMRPASGNHDGAGTYAVNDPWSPTSHARPAPFIPPDMVGGACVFALIDATGASTNWSHPDNSVVDDSIDWRGRIISVQMQYGLTGLATTPGLLLGSQPSGIYSYAPSAATSNGSAFANTISDASTLLTATASFVVMLINHVSYPGLPAGVECGLYVDAADGALRWQGSGPTASARPGSFFAFMLLASAPMSNP